MKRTTAPTQPKRSLRCTPTVIDLTEEDPVEPTPIVPIVPEATVQPEPPVVVPASRPTSYKNGTRLRRFVFTLNNWTQDEYNHIIGLPAKYPITWMVVAKETGKEGTAHLQGACCLGSQTAFSTIKTWPGLARIHLEKMRGSPTDSLAYCSKQDSHPFVFGTPPQQGKRSDLLLVTEEIKKGTTFKELANSDTGAVAIVKFHKGLTILRSLTRPDRSAPPKVVWIHGDTGVGKSENCWAACDHLGGGMDNIWTQSRDLNWFDSYDGQPCAIIDDFRDNMVSFDFLLRLLDKYPIQVPIKGGFVKWNAKFIFITTCRNIYSTFPIRNNKTEEDLKQLKRRITAEFKFPEEIPAFVALINSWNPGYSCTEFVDDQLQLEQEAEEIPPERVVLDLTGEDWEQPKEPEEEPKDPPKPDTEGLVFGLSPSQLKEDCFGYIGKQPKMSPCPSPELLSTEEFSMEMSWPSSSNSDEST